MYSISEMVTSVQLIIFGMLSMGNCFLKRQWSYEPLSTIGSSSDESKCNISFRVQRIRRDEYAVSGIIGVQFDSDDTTMFEMLVYKSQTGSEADYILMPFNIEKQPLVRAIAVFYKDLYYENFGNCSSIPQPKEVMKSPFPKGLYTFERCVADGAGMPNILPSGYYKIVFSLTGQVDCDLKAIVKVTTDRIF